MHVIVMSARKSVRLNKARKCYSPPVEQPKHYVKKRKKIQKMQDLAQKLAEANQRDAYDQKKQAFLSEKKSRYLENAMLFAASLARKYNIPEAENFFCPSFSQSPCQCLQNFLTGHDEIVKGKIEYFVQILNQAKALKQLKCYNVNKANRESCSEPKGIGLGNGHKKSSLYIDFVLKHRAYLREKVDICEKAVQKILLYSNNLLHKKLKTEAGGTSRIGRQKQLIEIAAVSNINCCSGKCVKLAKSHPSLVKSWRDRANLNQSEARRVIAEMLTPCRGDVRNCFKFIVTVTGCSIGTISKVNRQMSASGGDREPPEHGLKKWWREQAKCKSAEARKANLNIVSSNSASAVTPITTTLVSCYGDFLSDSLSNSRFANEAQQFGAHHVQINSENEINFRQFSLNDSVSLERTSVPCASNLQSYNDLVPIRSLTSEQHYDASAVLISDAMLTAYSSHVYMNS